MFLALLLSLVPASSFAGVLISVNIAPPVLPVYEQPPCPQPGWLWTPGYWAYGDEGYYWVPGAWVPAPYEGALWTPPYWGWSSGIYVFHPGYWGPHVGFYGGVNYGFGYMGVGFVGGRWHNHGFEYNTAVVRVNNVYIHNTYVDRTVVHHNTIVNERHVAYSGGPGGIRHDPSSDELHAMHERHIGATPLQQQHFQAARSDRSFYAKNNGGNPHTVAAERPMGYHDNRGAQSNMRPQQPNSFNNNHGAEGRPQYQQQHQQQELHQQQQHQEQLVHQPQYQHQEQQMHQQQMHQQQMHQQQYQQQNGYNQPAHGNSQQPRGNFEQPHGNPQQQHGNHEQPHDQARQAPQEHGGGQGHPQHEQRPHN
jgi:hypothetical protein